MIVRADILFYFGRTEVFFGVTVIAEQSLPCPTDLFRADRAGDLIVPGACRSPINGPNRVRRVASKHCLHSLSMFFSRMRLHIGHVTRPLDHHQPEHRVFPSNVFCQFLQGVR